MTDAPQGLLEAFRAHEAALMANDAPALDVLVADSPDALQGSVAGLFAGYDQIRRSRSVGGVTAPRDIIDVTVAATQDDLAVVVARTAPRAGGTGLSTQVWRRAPRSPHGWVVLTGHDSTAPVTFDPSVWRVVGDPLVTGADHGPLHGIDVAVKDVYDVAGFAVGAGVPQYLASAPVATANAAAVQRLLDAGADVRGIARCDQFAYSLAGDNPHYGTPVNAVVAGALPGGSSSGSATAVALGAATLGLATDTAGSVRVPASYQGLWAVRTTHGSVPVDGLLALAPDFDAVGLIARTPQTLSAAVAVLSAGATGLPDPHLIVPATSPHLSDGVESAFEAAVQAVEDTGLPVRRVELGDLSGLVTAFRDHQAAQAWHQHGAWLSEHPDAVSGAAGSRFEAASWITEPEATQARVAIAIWRRRLQDALGDGVLLLPAAASAAPRRWDTPATVDAIRYATVALTCIAGVTGRPAVCAPLLHVPQGPVGLSLVGPPGTDLALVGLATDLADRLA